MVIIPALLFGIAIQMNKRDMVKIPQYKLLFWLLGIIFLSNAVNGRIDFGIDQFVLFFKKACIFIMIVLNVRTVKDLKKIMTIMIVFSVFIAGQAIVQFISGSVGLAGQDFYRSGVGVRTQWVGLWDGANILSLLFNLAIPFALEFALNKSYSKPFRLFNTIMALGLIIGVYTTNSRGGFVTLMAILVIYPMFKIKKKKTAMILGGMLVAVLLMFFAPSRISSINTREASAHERTRIWNNAKDFFLTNKFLGIGKGRFDKVGRRMEGHSNFMQNLAEIGGIGTFVWVSLVYFSFKGLYYVSRLKAEAGKRALFLKSLATALLVSLIGFNVCTLFITMEIDIFYLLLGLCAAAVSILNREIKPFGMRFAMVDFRNICGIIVCLFTGYCILIG